MGNRTALIVNLEKTPCGFKLIMATVVSFSYKTGALVVAKTDARDSEATRCTRAKLLVGDLVQANRKVFSVSKVTFADKGRLVFVEAKITVL